MPRTITGTTTTGILLTTPTDSPVTIVSGALIESKPDNFALIGGSLKGQPDYNFPWTITNSGFVEGKGGNSTGVVLYGGGKIVNADIGYISGGRQGVYTYYQPATVVNFGTVSAYGTNGTGIFLSAGGQVLNAGTVFGDVGGVRIQGAHATVANYGTIKNRANAPFGVSIDGFFSNYVKNTAYIEDDVVETGARGTMVNSGTIEGSVSIGRGGIITNGISGSTTAHIDGFFTNIAGGTGTINNYGTVSGFFFGVDLSDGGTVNNAQPGAVITTGTGGQDGILISGYPGGTVTNLGTVKVNGTVGFAVNLGTAGGSFTNGSPSVTSAFAGFASPHYGDGFISDPAATITNFATISAANGMFLHGGGSVANNGTAASIYGRFNGVFSGGVATVDNTGTVEALFNFGVELTNGNIVNGSTAATGASIVADRVALVTPGITTTSTAVGIGIITSGSLTNYGTVAGARAGVRIAAGAVANGSAGARSGLVEGVYYGVLAAGTVTQSVAITNFGTIAAIGTAGIGVDLGDTADNTVSNSGTVGGTGGTAVAFGAGDDRLIVGAGARFNGVVTGGPGTNEIDFEKTGAVALAPEYVGFARVRLLAADSLALKPADLAGLAGNAIIVFDGNAGGTVSAAALTAGEHATVTGGSGNDVFVGGAGTDIFTGGAGNDAFDFSAAALAASDTVAGGSGSDTLVMTSAGTVVATGVSGVETWRLANGKPNSLQLTNGNFIATTGAAVAVIDGNAGDTVDAEALAASDRVTVTGGSGNDVFIGGAGKDAFAGNGGADTFRFSIADLSSSDSVKGGNGEDTLFLTSAGTVAAGGVSGVETYRLAKAGADALTLTAGNFAGVTAATITVMGGNAGNTVDAHAIAAGDHAVMIGGAGKDVLTGGPGADTFEYTIANLSANDVVRGGGGSDTLYLVGPGTLAAGGVSQIETYRLSNAGANTLTLTAGNFAGVTAATITVEGGASGNAVNASQEGAGARTVMIGGAGKDIFTGGAGNDILRFSPATLSAGDIVKGGGGNDTLLLTSAGTVAAGGVSQVETYRLANGGANALTLTAANFAGATAATITVFGGNAANTIDAHLAGASDRTVMVGGAGKDVFIGGLGADIFEFSASSLAASDIVQGGGGSDRLLLTSAGKIAATGVSGVETWRLANGAANTLSLSNANFTGTAAATIAVLGGGNGNTLSEAGVAASDWAVLLGGAGADILTAGQHAKLTGGAGADQFVFATPGTASSPDANTIADFAHGLDKIVFRDAGFNLGADDGKGGATPQRIAPSLFSPRTDGSFATAANRFAYDTKTGVLFYDADGTGAAHASQRIATLTDHPTLAAADLFFVK